MNRSKNILLIVIIFILLVLINGVRLYFIYQQQSEVSTTVVDSSTWKTYTNTTYNYQFKYPETATLSPDTTNRDYIRVNDKVTQFAVDPQYLDFQKGTYVTELTPAAIANENRPYLLSSFKLLPMNIHGIPALEQKSIKPCWMICDDLFTRTFYVQQSPGKPVLEVTVNVNLQLGPTILSTFQFTP